MIESEDTHREYQMKTQRNRHDLEYINEHESSIERRRAEEQQELRKAATRSHTYKCLNHNPLITESKRIYEQLICSRLIGLIGLGSGNS